MPPTVAAFFKGSASIRTILRLPRYWATLCSPRRSPNRYGDRPLVRQTALHGKWLSRLLPQPQRAPQSARLDAHQPIPTRSTNPAPTNVRAALPRSTPWCCNQRCCRACVAASVSSAASLWASKARARRLLACWLRSVCTFTLKPLGPCVARTVATVRPCLLPTPPVPGNPPRGTGL